MKFLKSKRTRLFVLFLACINPFFTVFAANPPLPAGAYYSHISPTTFIQDVNQNYIGIQNGQGQDSYFANPAGFYADATGTGDAIVLSIPNITQLIDGMTISFGPSGSNATTTPKIYLNQFSAATIVKGNGIALNVGDIPGSLSQIVIQYNAGTNFWSLVNPSTNFQLNTETFGMITMSTAGGYNGQINFGTVNGDQLIRTNDTSPFREGAWLTASGTAYTLCGSSIIMNYWSHNTALTATGGFAGTGDAGTATFYCYNESDQIGIYTSPASGVGVVPTFTASAVYAFNTASGVGGVGGHWSEAMNTTPTIASGVCGTGTNGTISGTDQNGKITIGASATTSCAVTFGSSSWQVAPTSCTYSPANAAAAAITVLSYISALATTGFTLTGSVLASTNWYYHCQ